MVLLSSFSNQKPKHRDISFNIEITKCSILFFYLKRSDSFLKKEISLKRNYFILPLYLPIAGRPARQVHGTNTRGVVPRDDGSVWR